MTNLIVKSTINPALAIMARLFVLSAGYEDAFAVRSRYYLLEALLPYLGTILGASLYFLLVGWYLKRSNHDFKELPDVDQPKQKPGILIQFQKKQKKILFCFKNLTYLQTIKQLRKKSKNKKMQ